MLALSPSSASPAPTLAWKGRTWNMCFALSSYHHPPCFDHCSCALALTKLASRFCSDSVDKPDDGCGKLLPERVWLGLHLKLLAKGSSVVFVVLCPASGQSHSAEGCTMWSRDAPLSGWQYLLLDYISSCFDMMKLRISSMCSLHSVSLPASALFFSAAETCLQIFQA